MGDSALTRAIRRRYSQTTETTPAATGTSTVTTSLTGTSGQTDSPLTRAIKRRYSQTTETTPAATTGTSTANVSVNREEYDRIKQDYVNQVLVPQQRNSNLYTGTDLSIDWTAIPDEQVPLIQKELEIVTDLQDRIAQAGSKATGTVDLQSLLPGAGNNTQKTGETVEQGLLNNALGTGAGTGLMTNDEVESLQKELNEYLSNPSLLKNTAGKQIQEEKQAAEYYEAGAEAVSDKGLAGRLAVNLGTNAGLGFAGATGVDTLRAVSAVENLTTPKKQEKSITIDPLVKSEKSAKEQALDTYDRTTQNYVAGMNSQLSGAEQLAGQGAQMLGAAAPSVLVSILFPAGGAAKAADAAADTVASVGKLDKLAKGTADMLKSPTFWTSAVPTYGRSYYEAKGNGATEAQAQIYGVLNGFAGAAIEVSGGSETLPGTQSGIRQLVKAALEEGQEEVVQGIVSGILQKALYDQDKEWASWTDPEAIINPERIATEAAWGAALGGIMGGGKIAIETAVQKTAEYSNALQVGNVFLNEENGATLEQAVALGLNTAKGSDTYLAAEKIQKQVESGKKVSAYAVGRMVLESQTDAAIQAKAIQDGVLKSAQAANIKSEVAETISAAAVQLKQRIVFASADSTLVAEKRAGAYIPATDTVALNPMASQETLLGYVLTHEMTHSADGTQQLATLEKTVRRMMGDAGWQQMAEQIRTEYAAAGIELDDTQVQKEVLASWLGQNLFKNGFAQAVVSGDATTGNVFLQAIDKVRRATIGKKNNPSASNIAMLERLFMQAIENKQGVRNGAVEYGIRQTSQMEYQDQLALIEEGTLNGGHSLYIGNIPSLESSGFDKAPFVMNQGDYRKSRRIVGNNKHYSAHAVSYDFFEKMPQSLNDAPMLIDNGKKVTVVTDVPMADTKGASSYVIAGVLRNETMEGALVHQIKSVYPLDDFANRIKTAAEQGKLIVKNKDKAKQMLTTIGVQPSEMSSIVDLARDRLPQTIEDVNTQSMQGGENHTQDTLLPEEKFTGDAIADNENSRPLPPMAESSAPGEGGYVTPVDEAQVLERAVQSTAQGQAEAQATDFDGILNELGEDVVLRRLYNASQLIRPAGLVTIDGQAVDANAYMDAFEQDLPEDIDTLEQAIRRLEKLQAEEILRQHQEGSLEEPSPTRLKIDLQLFAAKRKWDLLQLDEVEGGKKNSRFYWNRLQGRDELQNEELLELLAGRSETYDPISNQKTLDQANRRLQGIRYQESLLRKIGKRNAHLNAVDVAAATVLAKNAFNDGDYETVQDLYSALTRRGTEMGRAVQAFSMMRRMTPEGVLLFAKRTVKTDADYIIGEGANDGLDVLADDISGALNRLARLKGQNPASTESGPTSTQGEGKAVWDGTVGEGTPSMEGASREQVVDALVDDLASTEGTYLTREDIEENLEKIIQDATDVPEQVKRYVLKKIRKKDGGLAQRLYEMHRKGHLTADKTRQAMEEALELPTLSDNDVKTLVEMATKAQELSDDPVAQADAMDEIYDFLAVKMTVKGLDRLQAWRKFAMLFNVKTHVRNTVSNAAYAVTCKADDLVAMGLEKMFRVKPENRGAYLGWSHTEHGQSIMPLLQERAKTAVLEMQKRGAKYETGTGQLKSRRKFFGESKVGETLNEANTWNSNMLEKEDVWFFKPAYIDALGQMMTAQSTTEITPQMHERAMQRALEATFRADNAISEVVSSLKKYQNATTTGKRLFGQAVDVVIPFHKTPANIATQTVLHSPVGIVKGAVDLYNATKGKGSKDVATAINTIAKGLTGSALLAIGVLLGKAGLFNTGFGKTEKERAADELAGKQENAFIIGDHSITLDWLQPAASPLIIGASMGQRIQEDGLSISAVFGAVMDGTDSLFEMTMLQSLYDVLGGYDAGATATVASVAENVVSQSVPTLLGQVARAIDPVQRKTTGDSDFETIFNQVVAKIPLLTYFLDPELDVWGNEVYRTGKASTGNAVLNAAQQFILPWNTKEGTGADDSVSEELLRIFEEMGSSSVIPTAISRDEALDAGVDYVEANRTLGQYNREVVEDFLNDRWPYTVQETLPNGKIRNVSKYYSEMTDEERTRVLKRIYSRTKTAVTEGDEEQTSGKKSQEDRYFEDIFRRLQ